MPKNAVERGSIYLSPKHVSRQEKERRTNQLLVLGTAIVLGLVVLILGWGLLDQFVLQPRRPAAIVAGESISMREYRQRVKHLTWLYENYVQQLQAQEQQLASSSSDSGDQSFLLQYIGQQISSINNEIQNLPNTTLDQLIDEKLARQEAARRDIVVSQDEVDTAIEQFFGYDRNPPAPAPPTPVPASAEAITSTETITDTTPAAPTETPGPTETPVPTPTPLTYEGYVARANEWYASARQETGMSQQDFRAMMENSVYRDKVEEAIKAEVPTTAEQVHARHILLATQEEAEAALARLKDGEKFEDLAAELSQDTGSKDNGGDLGWFPRGQMYQEFEDAAFALQPGQLSDIVQTPAGFHIILVEEHDNDHPLDTYTLQQIQGQAVSDWYTAQRASQNVIDKLNPTPPAIPAP